MRYKKEILIKHTEPVCGNRDKSAAPSSPAAVGIGNIPGTVRVSADIKLA